MASLVTEVLAPGEEEELRSDGLQTEASSESTEAGSGCSTIPTFTIPIKGTNFWQESSSALRKGEEEKKRHRNRKFKK